MIPRIEKVKTLNNYMLYVEFKDGEKGFYNVAEDIEQIPQFEDLKAINGLFEQVQIDESKTCVYWSDIIDLPSDAIYENLIKEVQPMKDEVESIEDTKNDNETLDHNSINWD